MLLLACAGTVALSNYEAPSVLTPQPSSSGSHPNHKSRLKKSAVKGAGAAGRTVNDTASVTPMTCGALVYWHIGKTGGSSITNHLKEVSSSANYSSYKVWWNSLGTTTPHELYNYTQDPHWVNFKEEMNSQAQPKATLMLHHGVPGLAQYMWTAELQPMQQMLQAKGCELRLTTVVRDGSSRARSNFNYAFENWPAKQSKAHPECGSMMGSGGEPTDECVCQFAADDANIQVAYVHYGHLAADSVWDTVVGAAQGANPLGYLASGEEAINSRWAAKAADFLEQTSYLVGCTERLDSFGAALDAMLGVPATKMATDNPTTLSANLTSPVRTECIEKANVADNKLHGYFCGSSSK